MIFRLVNDAIRRQWWIYLWMAPVAFLTWVINAANEEPFGTGLTLHLALAYGLGPLAALSTTNLRELRVLPVTNRELWLTMWTISTVVGPFYMLAVQSFAISVVFATSGATTVPPETAALTFIYAVAYTGALLPVGPLLGYASGNISSRRPRWLWSVLTTVCLLLFVGGFVLPWWFAPMLPPTFDQLTALHAVGIFICLGITAASWAWTPTRGGFARPDQAAQRIDKSSSAGSTERFADRLTGIARIAWPLASVILSVAAGTFVAFVGYWALFESDASLRSFLQKNALLLFDTGFLPDPDGGRMWVVYALAALTMSTPWKPFGRQLKVLPLTAPQVNALLLATPFIQWALVWLALIAVHVGVIGLFPRTVRPDLFIFLGGISALGHGLMFRRGHGSSLWILLVIGAVVPLTERLSNRQPSMPVEVIVIAAGLIAFAVAAFINHRTLTRSTSSSKAYRPESGPFGITAPGAPR